MVKMWWGIIYSKRGDFSGFVPEVMNNLSANNADALSWLQYTEVINQERVCNNTIFYVTEYLQFKEFFDFRSNEFDIT